MRLRYLADVYLAKSVRAIEPANARHAFGADWMLVGALATARACWRRHRRTVKFVAYEDNASTTVSACTGALIERYQKKATP
jgi:hypothetical protein